MVREIRRHLDVVSKIEVVVLQDSFGAEHLVQQPMIPPNRVNNGTLAEPVWVELDDETLLLWHEAVIENEIRRMEASDAKLCAKAKARGHSQQSMDAQAKKARTGLAVAHDPLEGYQGCCG